jgi:hypothetical protein
MAEEVYRYHPLDQDCHNKLNDIARRAGGRKIFLRPVALTETSESDQEEKYIDVDWLGKDYSLFLPPRSGYDPTQMDVVIDPEIQCLEPSQKFGFIFGINSDQAFAYLEEMARRGDISNILLRPRFTAYGTIDMDSLIVEGCTSMNGVEKGQLHDEIDQKIQQKQISAPVLSRREVIDGAHEHFPFTLTPYGPMFG